MPVIVAANPKGGSGKSTTCLVIGTTLASQGASVRIIDADPQGTLAMWSEGSSKYRDLVVKPTANEDLTVLIDRLQSQFQFVIIDVQGSANQEMFSAMSRADLVLLPMQPLTADVQVAIRAIRLIKTQESLFKRSIAHAIVLIRTSPLIVKLEEKDIRKDIADAGMPHLTRSMNERTAFSHMIKYKLSLGELNESKTNGLDSAQENAKKLTAEVIALLRKNREVAA